MRLVDGNKEAAVNTVSNWPLISDLFIKWGYEAVALDIAKQGDVNLVVKDLDAVLCELSAWGIPWKRIRWDD